MRAEVSKPVRGSKSVHGSKSRTSLLGNMASRQARCVTTREALRGPLCSPVLSPPGTRRWASSGPSSGSRCAVGARLPCGRNEASTRAHIPELKTEEPQARDQSGAQAYGELGERHPQASQRMPLLEGCTGIAPWDPPPCFLGF